MPSEQPIHVGTINNLPVRFYPPQSQDDLMPWVAMDDLAHALGMNHVARRALARAKLKFPDLAKRIRAEGNRQVDVLAFQGVQGLMGGLKQMHVATDADHMAYIRSAVAAAEKTSPLLFDRGPSGELRVSSPMVAALLGEDHQAIVDRVQALNIDAEQKPMPSMH
jgi:hypothetical protein